jgi:hypothetical protein
MALTTRSCHVLGLYIGLFPPNPHFTDRTTLPPPAASGSAADQGPQLDSVGGRGGAGRGEAAGAAGARDKAGYQAARDGPWHDRTACRGAPVPKRRRSAGPHARLQRGRVGVAHKQPTLGHHRDQRRQQRQQDPLPPPTRTGREGCVCGGGQQHAAARTPL